MGRGLEHFPREDNTDGQQAYGNILNITDHLRNAI